MGVAWAFVAAGTAIEFVAFLLVRRSIRRLRAGGRATGEIVGSEAATDSSGKGSPKKYYLPVIRFTSQDGRSIVFTADSGGRMEPQKGTPVQVLYNPERPHQAWVNTFATLWFFPLITAILGLPFLLAGLSGL